MATQSAGGQAGFSNGVGPIHAQHLGNGTSGAERLLSFEGFGPVEGLGGDSPRLALVRAGLGFEGFKTTLAIALLPAVKGGHTEPAPRGVGHIIDDSGQITPHLGSGTG